MDKKEVSEVSENMIKYGGSFVKALGEALLHADTENQQKIKDHFSDYWKEYKNLGVL